MKKILLSILTVTTLGFGAMAQLPAGSFFEYEFTGGSLNNTSSSGAPNFTGSITSIADRNGSANDAADITGSLGGASVGATNVSEMTLSFWMKHGPISSNERIFQIYGTGGRGFRLQMTGSQLLYNATIGGNNSSSISSVKTATVNIDNSAWHHIAVRTTLINASILEFDIFLDNVLVPNLSNTTLDIEDYQNGLSITNFLMNANLTISPTNAYSGDIDDIYFYKSALTDAQITQLYNYSPPPCTVTIPDANFKAYLVGNTAINTNGNTEIECSEASVFTGTINCNTLSISDLTGIEAFTALTELHCANNSLTSLDVSNNIALLTLFCSGNSLTILDVSNNTGLTGLYCHGNSLMSLDLSTHTALAALSCQNNSLTYLNVANGNNTNIPALNFNTNSNPNLTCIEVDNIAYSTTNWTLIDAASSFSTNCTPPCTVTIPDANFKAYLVGNTAINTNGDTEIQCSEASAYTGVIACSGLSISDLTGIEAFTALTELYCSNNSLTSLDVTQNTALTLLYCQVNSISSLDVTQNTTLTRLLCQGNSLTSLDVSNNTSLTELDCGSSLLSSLDVTQNTVLTKLYCNQNSLTTLNVANGNNSNFVSFFANNNPNLTCITVDNVAYSATNWTIIDAGASFSTNCGTVGIDELSNESLSVYPNPVKNQLFIELDNKEVISINIIDITGKTVKTINGNSTTINVSDLTKGIYFLQIQTEKGLLNSKFIRE